MEYPPDVQKRIDVLNKYAIDNTLSSCDIIHIYPKGLAYPNGYYDARFFDMHIYNTQTWTKRIIEDRDGLSFDKSATDIYIMRIYADGSTFIRFQSVHYLDIFQCVMVL
jgi:hypothetical protein